VRGQLPDLISSLFLNTRCFHVRVGSSLFDLYDQEIECHKFDLKLYGASIPLVRVQQVYKRFYLKPAHTHPIFL